MNLDKSPRSAGAGPGTDTDTVDADEVERFARAAAAWWDPEGAFGPLHRLNPVRIGFIRDRLLRHFGRDPQALSPFSGLSLLDIGCGGGLVAEPMARLGFAVTAIDADANALEVARAHAAATGLAIDYRAAAVEDLGTGAGFDAVLALEVVEHVRAPQVFLGAAARLVRPGGALIAATINRTARSFLLAIIGAEHVLRWVPRGTHRWEKFLRPAELAAGLRAGGLVPHAVCGLVYVPGRGWVLASDLSTNFLLIAIKPKQK
ncbi:MAG TPA: bifunctional 2-polyprenyl-6-hydroxyphenol methylase/3-demethylubiquinol 3-O-methyltransferase UbiG [Stellaceae bacterium]|nr:bifunctional 2-polyprenyl-6-hydroxyphenol methylase/3-demethylubiquinol 3-O-methyltransferase UbiG [Stellaceae bacterium]